MLRLPRTVGDTRVRRLLSVVAFPLAAFAVWRVAQALLVWAFGGAPVGSVILWDGGWYGWILDHGYAYRPDAGGQQPTAFFPFLPWLTRGVALVVRSEAVAIGVVTTLGAAAAVVAVYGVARQWRGERVARAAVLVMLAYPVSFFLWSFYTEAIFIAATAGAFWAYRRDRHGVAAILAAVATMTRVPGVLVVVVLVALYVFDHRRVDRRVGLYALSALALVPVVIAQWAQAGDPLAFVSAGRMWGRHFTFPWEPVVAHVRWVPHTGIGSYRWSALMDLCLFALAAGAAVWACVDHRSSPEKRWPPESWIWIIITIALPLLTGMFVSMSRYTLAAWPVFVVLGDAALRIPQAARVVALVVSLAVSVLVLHWVAEGIFVA